MASASSHSGVNIPKTHDITDWFCHTFLNKKLASSSIGISNAAQSDVFAMLIGYCRVSKGDDQNDMMQRRALDNAGVRMIFADKASGGRWDRPELQRMLDQLTEEDVVLVWKLDRLTRSLKDLLTIIERIGAKGAGLRSLTEPVDTTTPAGMMMMQMIGSFAEFERSMIRERTRAGVAAARAEGRKGGRPHALTAEQRREVIKSVSSGRKTQAQMARLMEVSVATIGRAVRESRM